MGLHLKIKQINGCSLSKSFHGCDKDEAGNLSCRESHPTASNTGTSLIWMQAKGILCCKSGISPEASLAYRWNTDEITSSQYFNTLVDEMQTLCTGDKKTAKANIEFNNELYQKSKWFFRRSRAYSNLKNIKQKRSHCCDRHACIWCHSTATQKK